MSEDGNVPESALVAEQIRFAKNTLHRNLADIKSRCEAMLFRNFPSLDVAKSDWSILDVKVSVCIQRTCDYGSLVSHPLGDECDHPSNIAGIHEHPAGQ
jgi:hypothetical protein